MKRDNIQRQKEDIEYREEMEQKIQMLESEKMKLEEEKKDEEVVIPDIESVDQIKPQLPNDNDQLIQQL